MGAVEVELSGAGGVRRGRTDGAGRFQVSGLQPGWWRVRVVESGLPRHHQAEEQQWFVVAGGEGKVWLRVTEKQRSIQMIESGDLRVPE